MLKITCTTEIQQDFEHQSLQAVVMSRQLAKHVQCLDFSCHRFAKGHETDKYYTFPHVYWDIMPKASASQVHPHFHMALASGRYYGKKKHFLLWTILLAPKTAVYKTVFLGMKFSKSL